MRTERTLPAAGALAALLGVLPAVAFGAENRSAYTDLDQKACKLLERAPEGEGGDWARFECPGFAGYRVLVGYDDLRESLRLATPAASYRLDHGIASFNRLGPKLEWRWRPGERREPFAVIFRVYAQPGDGRPQRSFLFVGKVTRHGGCVVARVSGSARPGANVVARRIADRSAAGFRCGADSRIEIH